MVIGVLKSLVVGALTLFAIASPVNALPDRAAILDFIAKNEAPGGYDSVHAKTRESPPRPLTRMRFHEVLAWQRHIRPRVVSTAVGRYQFIYQTLTRLSRDYHLDPDRLFDKDLQDELANRLLDECGYGKRQLSPFANCLAVVWAALPRVSGRGTGRSAWHGVAGNRALVSRDAFVRFLRSTGATGPTGSTATVHYGHPGIVASRIGMTLAKPKIRYLETNPAIVRNINQARENGSLGESVVVKFRVDPYRVR